MKKPSQQLLAEALRSVAKVGMTTGIDLGDVWSHYYTLNEDGEVVERGRFRTTPSGVEKWFSDLPRARVAMDSSRLLSLLTTPPRLPETLLYAMGLGYLH